MSTLKDIAKEINVSIGTVSRVLNHDDTLKINPATRQAILSYARKIGYQKKPKKNQNRLVGVIVWISQKDELNDPYFMEIRHGIEKAAEEAHVFLMTVYKQEGLYALEKLQDVEGLICIGKFTEKEISQFETITKTMVFVDSSPSPIKYSSVMIDYEQSTTLVLEYLLSKQYPTIGFLGGIETLNDASLWDERRLHHVKTILKKHHLYNEKHIHIGAFSAQSGYLMMQKIIQNNTYADAYFCASDMIAIGALKALHEANIKVPDQVALVGFNDIAQATYTHPALTTLKVYTEVMGEEALKSIIEKLDTSKKLPIKKIVPTKLIVRRTA